MKRPPIEAI